MAEKKQKPETMPAYARRHRMAIVRLGFNMNHLLPEQRVEGTISNLGVMNAKGPIPMRAAEILWAAYHCGAENKLNPTEKMLFDLLDGTKGAHEIHEQTGLPMERCEEIYQWYSTLDPEMTRGE